MAERVQPAPAPPKRIWLIGLMGSGKSTVGRAPSSRLGCEYIDNDETIAALAGQSTVELAGARGDLLHEWESRYVRYLAALPGRAIAGIPASAADRGSELRLLSEAGLLVYLRCDLPTLTARIRADPPRPWIDGNAEELLAGMLATRGPALERSAQLIVDAGRPVPETVTRIAQAYRAEPRPVG